MQIENKEDLIYIIKECSKIGVKEISFNDLHVVFGTVATKIEIEANQEIKKDSEKVGDEVKKSEFVDKIKEELLMSKFYEDPYEHEKLVLEGVIEEDDNVS